MKEFFTIDDLSVMTMLSTRTIRNYITKDFLSGKKIDGVWRFTADDIDKFFKVDFVNQSVQSKKYGIVFNYLSNEVKNENSVCSIYDYSNVDNDKAENICNRMIELVNSNQYGKVTFSYSYNGKKKIVRILLTGTIMDIHTLMNDFINLSQ
ncbi:helix-turn-helix domain-containing protein [Anaerocolumna sp. MB42-C2]|uniref:helix-turn-helix domain-containing protein n=1 Tax=Anaerocolumna sp. MB42-C2 TaxID=3070997 RepID=UPI0027E1E73F|nr:helix-turn-helix domain-containing protein [Anaerocolumna sp. MB42-C2]WMJ87195.1 helix-turn-helix domain-containing protein [Anaerocolumna sp. MB42-C2]